CGANGNGAPPAAAPLPGPVGPGAGPGGLGAAGKTPPAAEKAEKADNAERADSVVPPAEPLKGPKTARDDTPAPGAVPTSAEGAQPGALPSGIRPGSAD